MTNAEVPDTNDGDTISRQLAIEAVRVMQTYKLSEDDDMLLVDQAEVMTELMIMPSAEPEDTIEMQESDIDEAMKLVRDARLTILPSAESSSKREWYQKGYRDGLVRMKGKWVKQIDESINAWWYECSVCGDYPLKDAFGHDCLSQFCPLCGTEMSEGEESHEDIPEGSL